ncbi:unnamed protein product, partial [marine sediment metagenome]
MAASKSIQEQLRRAIVSDPLSRYALAKLTGVTQPVLSQFVRRNRSITMDTAAKLAAVLGLELRPVKQAGKGKKGKVQRG